MSPRQLLTARWKSITANWGQPEWAAYATRRLNTLLQSYPVCSAREMEARLSEFGLKLNPRAEPHHLTTARRTLKLQVVSSSPVRLYALPNVPLDSSGEYKLAVIGIEVKNIREWIYPESVEIWKAIKACLDLHCIPIIISRAFHYTSFYFFRSIGILGHETQKQYFAYDFCNDPVFQSIKDELYFKDMTPWKVTKKGIKLDSDVVKFLSYTLPKMIERTSYQFELNNPLLLQYATGPLHREDTPIYERSALMEQFRDAFKQFHSTSYTGW